MVWRSKDLVMLYLLVPSTCLLFSLMMSLLLPQWVYSELGHLTYMYVHTYIHTYSRCTTSSCMYVCPIVKAKALLVWQKEVKWSLSVNTHRTSFFSGVRLENITTLSYQIYPKPLKGHLNGEVSPNWPCPKPTRFWTLAKRDAWHKLARQQLYDYFLPFCSADKFCCLQRKDRKDQSSDNFENIITRSR